LFSKTDKDNYIGVDIGSYAVKVCQLSHGRKEIFLKSLGLANLPSTAIVNGVIKEPRAIAETLHSLLAHLQIKTKEIVFAISGYSVIIKKIVLPFIPEKELAQSIEYEAQQHIPFDIKEVNLDFQVLKDARGDKDSMPVLLVAAKKEILADYLDVFELAGLKASIADVAAFALANAYENNYPLDPDPVALVNLGAGQITLHVLNQYGPVFTRDIFSGGRQLTEQIQSFGNMTFEEAERIKLERDKMANLLDRIGPSFLSIAQSWTEEIKQVLDFLAASDPENKPAKIILSGGTSLMLRLPVELFNPFSQVRIDREIFDPAYLQDLGPQMAIAFGLALRQKGK
jgi:type IV pilus assembly protein PilM